jgi:hypothetical protein
MRTGTATVLTPYCASPAIRLSGGGRFWRKRVLPVGDVEYNGRMLHFTRTYNDALAAAFRDRAYDQVSFQLADSGNAHTNDPERHRGTIVAMTSEDDGLYVTLDPTERGQRVLSENPYLGVSARIVEQYSRSDGRFYPAAIQHILGTLDPRIPALGSWSPVDMSNGAALVIDLSQQSWAGDDSLSDREMQELLDAVAEAEDEDEGDDDGLAAWVDSLTDDELAELEAEAEADGYADPGGQDPYGEFNTAFEDSAAAQQARAAAREQADIEDAIMPVRRDEDILARALQRVQAGIYTDPGAGYTAALASENAAIELAAATGYGPCGPVDLYGRCSARYHDLECAHGVSTDWVAAGAPRATSEAALANLALEHFGSTPPQYIWGDPDGGDPDSPVPQATVELAGRLSERLGLRDDTHWPVAPSVGELFSQPYVGDPYGELAAEVGLDVPQPEQPQEVSPAVHDLAVRLGLV